MRRTDRYDELARATRTLRFRNLSKSPLSLKASLLTLFYRLLPSDTERASAPASIAESFNEGDLVHATASESSSPTLSKAETLELFFSRQVLDVTFHQTFTALKLDIEENEAATQSQLNKLKTGFKASSSFILKKSTMRVQQLSVGCN